jgi:pilus assembly protein CpaB
MNTRSLFIAIGALFIAVIAALFARNLVSGSATPQPVAKTVVETKTKIIVAVKALPTGKILTLEDIKFTAWSDEALDPTFYRQGAAELSTLVGKVVRAQVLAGQPISNASIIGPGERGFLAAVLKPGMRAVSIPVSLTTGVGGFIFPGDRVDIILTHEVPNGTNLPLRGSETILSNVRVLAMNQLTNDTDKTPQSPNTVTLEVQPKFVELIQVADRLGDLSLSLQPITSNEEALNADKANTNQQTDAKMDAAKSMNAKTMSVKATDAKGGIAATSEKEIVPTLVDVKSRSLTLDREFSKLVTMAKTNNGNTPNPNAAAATTKTVAPAKPDIVISRGDAAEKVFFKQPAQ